MGPWLGFRGKSARRSCRRDWAKQGEIVGGAWPWGFLEWVAGVPHQVVGPEFPPITVFFTLFIDHHKYRIPPKSPKIPKIRRKETLQGELEKRIWKLKHFDEIGLEESID